MKSGRKGNLSTKLLATKNVARNTRSCQKVAEHLWKALIAVFVSRSACLVKNVSLRYSKQNYALARSASEFRTTLSAVDQFTDCIVCRVTKISPARVA